MQDTNKRVDRAEIARRVERAEKLLQKGKTADALEEYLQIAAVDPGNDTVCQMAADLCLSLQRIPEAIKLLGEMYDRQVEGGDATRASLTYKKLSRFVNPTWEQKLRFGQLLESSNRKLAMETYENALQELVKQGRKQDSVVVLNRIVTLEPTLQNLTRLGELASEAGDSKGAAAAFLRVAELTQVSGGKAGEWIERAYAEDPSDPQIALAYGNNLLVLGQVGAAIFVFEPLFKAGSASHELQEAYAKALLAANRAADAEPVVWQLFEQNPSRLPEIGNLIGLFLDSQQDTQAVSLARKLEQFQRRKGDRRGFLTLMQDIIAAHRASPEMLEFMSDQFNASNREGDYCQTLLKLFDLYYSMGNYPKAAESLDRAAEVDAYEPGHQKRLETLRGKIDDNRYRVIASRFSSMAESTTAPVREEKVLGAAALQDLMLQAEILVQYGMRAKAVERLQRIQELFPHEEERNHDLQQLYLTAGLVPRYTDAAPSATAGGPVTADKASRSAPEPADVSTFARVADITRKLYRQGNPEAVMSTTANEVGTQWKVSRCIVAMRKPGSPSTTVTEFCSEGMNRGNAHALEEVVAATQELAISRGTLSITDAQDSPELAAIHESLTALSIGSLLALPLSDGPDHVGLLLLVQNSTRSWSSNDVVVLKTISDQVVMALNNAGLRRLVRNLSVTDEKSGLLKRASYLDLLLAEVKRAIQQSTALSVLLVQVGDKVGLVREAGEAAIEDAMQRAGQVIASNIRQNDLAFRYDLTTVAVILGETSEKEGMLAVEKLRKLLAAVRLPGKEEPLPFSAGLAEGAVREQYDSVDIVTELINRAEQALEQAMTGGSGQVVALAPALTSAAVA